MPIDLLPLTVAPSAGNWIDAVNAPGAAPVLETVTVRVAVAVRPTLSVTVSPSVCAPLATPAVFHAYVAVVALTVCRETSVPSTVSTNVTAPVGLPADIRTVVVPLTVAPAAGAVNAAVSGGCDDGEPAF